MSPFKSALASTLIYVVFGALWILYSDRFLEGFVDSTETLTQMQTYKGWFFVFVTGLLFLYLMYNALTRERKLHERDELTELLNRTMFRDEVNNWIRHYHHDAKPFLIALINVDNFRTINHSAGHQSGDQLLKSIAALLEERYAHSPCLIARTGGDEFAIAMYTDNGLEACIEDIREIQRKINELQVLSMPNFRTKVGIGIAVFPDDASDVKSLLSATNIALEEAKELGQGQLRLYDHMFGESVHNRLQLSQDLQQALNNRELYVVYQPQFDARSLKITGIEALLRWNHPELGPIRPDIFIPLAEQQGLIGQITDFVCQLAFQELHDSGLFQTYVPRLSINVSALDFERSGCTEAFQQRFSHLDDWSFVQLELTETAIMENYENTRQVLDELRQAKVQVSIDDFGTGYSSLNLLRRLPVNEVKIERSFIRDIPRSDESNSIVRTIIAMARSLRLRVIAEGVETPAQVRFLQEEQCDELQGFYLSKPMRIDALGAFCKSYVPEKIAQHTL
ncbi:putative bifunctional diguanylate cyclase/phosphodiesterase [Aliidiomarina indica]|uniref:putative bifunctional diguanylate cyclase/phosphodiesterase n=1 Tax=Aliidiomarina indica TaxID=2749147 RepID=UPI00188E0DCE|nr:GGDEF domain-containing phosphodiesterase [Aliidiomarina indica]